MEAADFIQRWRKSGAGERSNFQSFIRELCDLIGVPPPDPATPNEDENNYVFEKRITAPYEDPAPSSYNWIDLYRRGSFVLEGKQSRKRLEDPRRKVLVQLGLELSKASTTRVGAAPRDTRRWDAVMTEARNQAERYAKWLPLEHGWPPFILVVDVGNIIEVWADFSL